MQTELDTGDPVGHLARDKLLAAPRALVVEEDTGDGKELVALAIVDGDIVAKGLRDAIGAARIEGRQLILGRLAHTTEHLTAGGLIETRLGADTPHRFQDPHHADSGELARQDRLIPGGGHKRHRRQVVNLIGTHRLHQLDQGELIKQIGLVQFNLVTQMVDTLKILGAGPPHHAMDLIALLQQKISQIRSILTGNAGYQSHAAHALSSLFVSCIPVDHIRCKCTSPALSSTGVTEDAGSKTFIIA